MKTGFNLPVPPCTQRAVHETLWVRLYPRGKNIQPLDMDHLWCVTPTLQRGNKNRNAGACQEQEYGTQQVISTD